MMKMNPYLTFDGQCEEAFKFYADVLHGKIDAIMPFKGTPAEEHMPAESRDKVMHASLTFEGGVLMGTDAPPAYRKPMQGMSVSLQLTDPQEAERLFTALAEGGTVTMPMEETFWALRFGAVTDRFGTPWMINCDKPA
jgi:PhnB protein